jgi:ABC-2 type transport system permease protein
VTTNTPVRTLSSTTAPTFWQSAGLVAGREITMKLRSKAFLFSALFLLVVIIGSIVIGNLVAQNAEDPKVATVSGTASVVEGVEGLDVTSAASEEEAEQLIRNGDVEAAILPADDELGYRLVALESEPSELVQLLSVRPQVELLDPADQSDMLIYFVALGFGLVFFSSAITFGATISQSVVEEKQTRVVEILMSAIPARALLAGKVIGNSVLALAQIVLTAIAATLALALTGQQNLVGSLGPSVLWFIGFFAIGFLLLAALFAASSALVSRQEDVGSVTTPVTMLVMIPYFLVIFFNDNDLVLTIMSYVPFSAPVGMPMRIFLGDAQWWEPILSLAIIAATAAVVVVAGARIYENSLLRTGPRVKLGEALKG